MINESNVNVSYFVQSLNFLDKMSKREESHQIEKRMK